MQFPPLLMYIQRLAEELSRTRKPGREASVMAAIDGPNAAELGQICRNDVLDCSRCGAGPRTASYVDQVSKFHKNVVVPRICALHKSHDDPLVSVNLLRLRLWMGYFSPNCDFAK